MEYHQPSDRPPQFIQQRQVSPRERDEDTAWLGLAVAPFVAAVVQLFWAALDEPPLEPLAWLVEIAAVVLTAAFAVDLARQRGVPFLLAIVIGVVVTPILIFVSMFFVIAAAFSLGSIV